MNSDRLIYIASPYSHPDQAVRAARHEAICRVAGALMARGLLVFSPIGHTHPIAEVCDLPRGWDFWARYDRRMIEVCDEVWVCTLPGWRESRGVQAEIALALEMGKTVRLVDEAGIPTADPITAPDGRAFEGV